MFHLGPVPCSLHSISELLLELRRLLEDKTLAPRTILCVNAHIYNLACRDAALRSCLNRARIVAADGMSIVWAARWLGFPLSERCNFTEAYHAFLQDPRMPPNRAILIGCSQAEAERAASRAGRVSPHCRIVGAYSGYLTDTDYERILATEGDVDLILIGMGTPRSERLADLATRLRPAAIVWTIGGGTVRIEAGTLREAPQIWRRVGLQWLYRLIKEPRLWRRYLLGNLVFVLRIIGAKLGWAGSKHVEQATTP